MQFCDPSPYWGWAIKGIGGVLTIMESYVADKLELNQGQMQMVEYQAARLNHICESLIGRAPKTKRAINLERSFSSMDVIEDSLEGIERGIIQCASIGEEIDSGVGPDLSPIDKLPPS